MTNNSTVNCTVPSVLSGNFGQRRINIWTSNLDEKMNRRRAGKKNMIILSGNSNRELASKIATRYKKTRYFNEYSFWRLQIDISPSKTVSFANGETNVDIEVENSRRKVELYICRNLCVELMRTLYRQYRTMLTTLWWKWCWWHTPASLLVLNP